MKLDRNRKYGTVYGHDTYRFQQDGVYFDGQGNSVGGSKKPDVTPAAEPPQVVENPEAEAKAERLKKLNKMSVAKVRVLAQKVAEQLDLDMPEGGTGAKGRYVKFLVDNTTD